MGPDAMCDHFGFVDAGGRQQYRKFLAAVSNSDVCSAEVLSEDRSYYAECFITLRMAEPIVIRLELVHVDHQETQLLAGAVGAIDLLPEAFLDIAPIEQACERIGNGKLCELSDLLAKRYAV